MPLFLPRKIIFIAAIAAAVVSLTAGINLPSHVNNVVISCGQNSEDELDSIANYYLYEIEQLFSPNLDRMFVDIKVSTENYPFMDELVGYITETIESYPTSTYSMDEMRNGVYNIEIYYFPYGNVRTELDPYAGSQAYYYSDIFNSTGSYIIKVWFHKEINVLDAVNFKYQGLNFATTQFLLPFFNDITDISMYPLYDYFDENGYCAWNFIVLCGHVVKAQYVNHEYYLSSDSGPTEMYYDMFTKQSITANDFSQYSITYGLLQQ